MTDQDFEQQLSAALSRAVEDVEGAGVRAETVRRVLARRRRIKFLAAAAVGIVILGVTTTFLARGGDQDGTDIEVAGAPALDVVDSGFSTYPGEFGTTVGSYGVVVENRGSTTALGVEVSVEAYTASGDSLHSQSHWIDRLPGDGTTGLANSFTAPEDVARLRVHITFENDTEAEPEGEVRASNISTTSDAEETLTTFDVRSTYRQTLHDTQAFAIFRSSGGEIIGGGFTNIDDVSAGGTASGQVSQKGDLPDIGSTEIYLNPDLD